MSGDEKLPQSVLGETGVADEEDDPELLAQLQAWFGGPFGNEVVADDAQALDGIDPALLGTSREPGIPDFLRIAREAREQTLDTVDPAFITALEDKNARWSSFGGAPQPPAPVLDPSISSFDASSFAHVAHGVGTRMTDEDVVEALQHCTPQALLRDLHRVVESVRGVVMEPMSLGVPKFAGRSSHISDVFSRRYTVFIDQEPVPRRYLAQDWADLNTRIRHEDWELPDLTGQERAEWTKTPSADDMFWFAGIDPSSFRGK